MKDRVQEFFNRYRITDVSHEQVVSYVCSRFGCDIDFIGKEEATFDMFILFLENDGKKDMTLRVAFDVKPVLRQIAYIKEQVEVLEKMIDTIKPTLL